MLDEHLYRSVVVTTPDLEPHCRHFWQAGLRELADKNTEKIGRVKRMNAMAPAEVEALLDAVDTDKSGTISYQEFITAIIVRPVCNLNVVHGCIA